MLRNLVWTHDAIAALFASSMFPYIYFSFLTWLLVSVNQIPGNFAITKILKANLQYGYFA